MAVADFFDRTERVIGGVLSVDAEGLAQRIGSRVVSIMVPQDRPLTTNEETIAELTVDLVARFFPALHISGESRYARELISHARAINPKIDVVERRGLSELTVAVGAGAQGAGIFVRADGWVATLGTAASAIAPGPTNPYSASAAACLGVGELMRRALHLPRLEEGAEFSVSLLDYSGSTGRDFALPATNLGEVAYVGLGGVGQAGLWALGRHDGITGTIRLVDDEGLELSNLQRYVGCVAADEKCRKTKLADRALSRTALVRRLASTTLENFARTFNGAFRVPTICISVDNVEGRRVAQALLPRLVVNGFTGAGNYGASWHEFDGEKACLACLYQPSGPVPSREQQLADACGLEKTRVVELLRPGALLSNADVRAMGQRLRRPEEAIRAWQGRPLEQVFHSHVCGGAYVPSLRGGTQAVPFAFQSALAGVLMAAELVKRLDPTLRPLAQPQTCLMVNRILGPPPADWRQPMLADERCICRDPVYREVYDGKWRSGGRAVLPPREVAPPASETPAPPSPARVAANE